MTAPADSRISDEAIAAVLLVYRLKLREYDADFHRDDRPDDFWKKKYGTNLHSIGLGEEWAMRHALEAFIERRAQAVTGKPFEKGQNVVCGPDDVPGTVEQCFDGVGGWRVIIKVEPERANPKGLRDFPASAVRAALEVTLSAQDRGE